jgi:hypothetical protein
MSCGYNEITQGELLLLKIKPLDEDGNVYDLADGVWSCDVAICNSSGTTLQTETTTTKNDVNDSFLASFDESKTEGLAVGDLTIAWKVSRTDISPQIVIKDTRTLRIAKAFI